tara:strand:+ start:192 stop:449 length:258 start_codon:yes stop_codon:yes gene_type:complete
MTDKNEVKQNINVETDINIKRKKLVVNWPTGKFSIADLEKSHPSAVPITLRFRVKKALESGTITPAGKVEGEIGRPTLLFEKVGN